MLRKYSISIFIPLFLILYACSNGHGLHVSRNNISCYYEEDEHKEIADKIVTFILNIGISPNKNMDVKLLKSNTKFQLLLIKNDAFKSDVNFEEIKLLSDFQDQLNSSISEFKLNPCEVALADNQFKILEIPNPL